MFQNEQIAKRTGQQVTNTLKRLGHPQAEATGKEAEDRKRAKLNKWTRENVGLD